MHRYKHLIVWLCLLTLYSCQDKKEIKALQEQLKDLKAKKARVDHYIQKFEKLEELNTKLQEKKKTIEELKSIHGLISPMLKNVSQKIPTAVHLEEFFYSTGTIDLIVTLSRDQGHHHWERFLENSNTFKDIRYYNLLLILGVSISFEIIFKTTPGKFLLKLQTIFDKESLIKQVLRPILKYLLGIFSLIIFPFNKKHRLIHEMLTRSTVKKLPCKKRLLRGIGAFISGLYLFITFGIGNIAWEVMKRKSKFERLYDIPQKFSVPQKKRTTTGIPIWKDGFRYYLPEKIQGHHMESHPLFQSYGRKREKGTGKKIILQYISMVPPAASMRRMHPIVEPVWIFTLVSASGTGPLEMLAPAASMRRMAPIRFEVIFEHWKTPPP
jgi:hypothetical protein